MKLMNLSQAAACLAAGGLLIYPTETFYALGCRADMPGAIDLVYQLKGRPAKRPLALVAASAARASAMIRLEEIPAMLWRKFWPGPLSLIVWTRAKTPDPRIAPQGLCAVRVPGNGQARRLAGAWPLTASSANLSGRAPVKDLRNLDPKLLDALENCGAPWGVLPAAKGEEPAGGLPSTLARPVRDEKGWRVEILREGAISRKEVEKAMNDAADAGQADYARR